MLSPIEQFELIPVLVFTNILIYSILSYISINILFKNKYILQKHIEYWYRNFNNVENHIFILLTIWFLILLSNLIGMIPYCNTITAQTIIVLAISIPTFISLNIFGLLNHSYNLLYLFLPTGVPLLFTPFIILLEILSYFIRVISLTLRLFANMVSGHILVKIIIYALLLTPFYSLLLFPLLILEIMVAIIQAYVFITLTLSYYQDVILPH